MDKVITKQKVYGEKYGDLKGTEWCAKDEAKAIGEKKS